MALYVFTDLDDTLFQTLGKCPTRTDLSTLAVDRQGNPLSYATSAQQVLLAWLQHGVVIPVTGRNSSALARVQLPFQSFRITSHGAMVVGPDGLPDTHWLASLGDQLDHWRDRMNDALMRIEALCTQQSLALRCQIIEDQGLPCYLSVKGEQPALEQITPIANDLWAADWVHRNGENMALLPTFASKSRAMAFVLEKLRHDDEPLLTIGLGDSLTDLPFMRHCDYAMVPQRSQIQEQLWP